MVPAILAQIGVPVLAKVLSKALDSIDKPVAKTAAEALFNIDMASQKQEIDLLEIKTANEKISKMMELEAELDSKTLKEINETMRKELEIDDNFIRRWRPAFGYAVALAWFVNMGAVAFVMVVKSSEAPAIISSLLATTPLWAVALGVLGVSVVKRSQDKRVYSAENKAFADIVEKMASSLLQKM